MPGDEAGDGDEGADAPVAVPPADPVFTAGAAVTLAIAEGHAEGASVGTVAATDANGDVLAYSLSGADAASFTIDAATGEISVAPGVSLDFDTRSSHSVTAAVSDGNDADGNPEDTPTEDATIAVTIEVTEAPGDDESGGDDAPGDGESGGDDAPGDESGGDDAPGDDAEGSEPADDEADGLPTARRTGNEAVRGTQDGPTATQQPSVPMGCGDVSTTTEWFQSVTATATLITVTYLDPLPGATSGGVRVCGPHGANDAYVSIQNTNDISPFARNAAGRTEGISSNDGSVNSAALLKPDTDYWIRVNASYAGEEHLSSAWTHVRTAPGTATPPMACGTRTSTADSDILVALSATATTITARWQQASGIGSFPLQLCNDDGNITTVVADLKEGEGTLSPGEAVITKFGVLDSSPALTENTEYWVRIQGYGAQYKWHYIRTLTAGPAAPVFTDEAPVLLSIAEDHADGASVGTVAATDANGDTLTYSLSGTDAASFTIDTATGEISVAAGVSLDFETKTSHSVTVSVTDGKDADGNDETTATVDATITVAIAVVNVDEEPTVAITSDPGAGDLYSVGEHIEVSATFEAAVTVTGTPRLKIGLAQGSEERWADYHRGTGSKTLVFRYTPENPDASTAGVAVLEDTLELNGGTIKKGAANALLSHGGLGHDTGHLIDTVAPTVSSALYHAGDRLAYLHWSEELDTTTGGLHNAQITYAIAGSENAIGNAFYDGSSTLKIALGNVPAAGQTATLAYSYDSTDDDHTPIRDVAGNHAAVFTGSDAKTLTEFTDPAFDDGDTLSLTYAERPGLLNMEITVAASDDDGDTLEYSVESTAHFLNITRVGASTGVFRVAGEADFEAFQSVTAVLGVSDGRDATGRTEETRTADDTITLTLTITDVDEPPTCADRAVGDGAVGEQPDAGLDRAGGLGRRTPPAADRLRRALFRGERRPGHHDGRGVGGARRHRRPRPQWPRDEHDHLRAEPEHVVPGAGEGPAITRETAPGRRRWTAPPPTSR